MTTSIVRRIDSRNKANITRDIDACLFYAGAIEWHFENAQLVITSAAEYTLVGTWAIVKQSKPQWAHHYGYTFERDVPGGVPQQLWDITSRTAPSVTVEEALAAENQARIDVVNRMIDVLDAAIETVNACTSAAEIYSFTNGLDFLTWSSVMIEALTDAVETKIATFKTPPIVPHKHRETVINRAITQNHYITDSEVSRSHTLRDVAVDYIETYKGTNTFVQDLALCYSDGGSLSIGQMRGALNVMVKEAKQELNKPDPKAFYVNLADVPQPSIYVRETDPILKQAAWEERNGRVVPNGTYTVPINDAGEYRVIKLTDCPEGWNKPAGTQIAAFQSGADNESAFTGFAFVNGIHEMIWKKYRNESYISFALTKLLTTGCHGEFGKIWAMASKKCFICGRKLTVPISKRAGIGPICADNVGIDIEALAALNISEGTPTTRAQAQANIDELFES